MTQVKREDISRAAQERKDRIKEYVMQDPPIPIGTIAEMEGLTNRTARIIIKEIEQAEGIDYFGKRLRRDASELPYGLTSSTIRMRQKLGDHLYLLLERGQESSKIARNAAAARIGLGNREQIRAEQRPFNHDWKLSQMERLARELNREPREFILACLTG